MLKKLCSDDGGGWDTSSEEIYSLEPLPLSVVLTQDAALSKVGAYHLHAPPPGLPRGVSPS